MISSVGSRDRAPLRKEDLAAILLAFIAARHGGPMRETIAAQREAAPLDKFSEAHEHAPHLESPKIVLLGFHNLIFGGKIT
jgi:hypothetical protein